MEIELDNKEIVEQRTETHYEVTVNGKTVWVSHFVSFGEHLETENETEIFKGEELLTDEEIEAVLDFIEEEGYERI